MIRKTVFTNSHLKKNPLIRGLNSCFAFFIRWFEAYSNSSQGYLRRWFRELLLPVMKPTSKLKYLNIVGLKNALPFVGFGFLDNVIMIVAVKSRISKIIFYKSLMFSYFKTPGWLHWFDAGNCSRNLYYGGSCFGFVYNPVTYHVFVTFSPSLNVTFLLGNTISDVAGIASAWYVEHFAEKFGIHTPKLTTFQANSWQIRWSINVGRAIGVALGCFLGMIPLFFFLWVTSQTKTRRKIKLLLA